MRSEDGKYHKPMTRRAIIFEPSHSMQFLLEHMLLLSGLQLETFQALELRSDAWFQARIGRITMSNLVVAVGRSPFQTPQDLAQTMAQAHNGIENEKNGLHAYILTQRENIQIRGHIRAPCTSMARRIRRWTRNARHPNYPRN